VMTHVPGGSLMSGEVAGIAYSDEASSPAWVPPRDGLQDQIEAALAQIAPSENLIPERLSQSMRYSLLAPGKRVRTRITVIAAVDLGATVEQALVPGCTIEMVHAASLIIDDLPVMDDASLRRGVPTNHRVYGEDTAILAAIGLLTDAFGAIANHTCLAADIRTDLVAHLSRHVGPHGLVAGQEMDLHHEPGSLDAATVEAIHARKTSALFACAAWAGARIAGRSAAECEALEAFGQLMGLAFQTYDDLADSHGHPDEVGKDTGNDGDKTTLVTLYGAEDAMRAADGYFARALGHLDSVVGGAPGLTNCALALQSQLKARISWGAEEQ
jgi:geranylgeranyl diphosphate synthase type II